MYTSYWIEKKIKVLCKNSYLKNNWSVLCGNYYNAIIYSDGGFDCVLYVCGCKFSINGYTEIYEDYSLYFYTEQEIRKLKLERLKNV